LSVPARTPYEPLRFSTKAEAVHVEIRQRILTGAFEPGSLLNQESLAADLGVSVTPVREAVRRLEAEGLLSFEAHKTVIVAPLSRVELQELYDVRLQLDPHAARLAATRADEEVLTEIERLARTPPELDVITQLARNREFHRLIYAASGNATLTEILDRLWERTDRYRVVLLRRTGDALAADQDHLAIAAAMSSRDGRGVARLIREHIVTARAIIEETLDG
jgi:DNA-binding GntR family transcriptional regulator